MIVSGGQIIALGKVEHDATLSGDGRVEPLGLDSDLLREIQSTSGKMEKSVFESWSAQTANWDITEYIGTSGIGIRDHHVYVSADYMYSSGMSGYAQSAWVEENFLKKTDKPDVPEYFGGFGIERSENGDNFNFSFSGASSTSPVSGDGTEARPLGLEKNFTDRVNNLYDDVETLKTDVDDLDRRVDDFDTASARWDTYSADRAAEVFSTDGSITVTSGRREDGTSTFDLSVEKIPVPSIFGYSGVKAEYNEEAQQYEVGLSGDIPANVEITSSGETISVTSSGEGHFNLEIEAGKLEFSDYISQEIEIGTTATTIPLEQKSHSDGFDLANLASHGLYHVDINLEFKRTSNLTINEEKVQLYDNSNGARIDISPLDASIPTPQTVNISYDFMQGSYALKLKGESEGWTVRVVRFDIHRIFDRDVVGDIIADVSQYTGINGIRVNENDHTISPIPGLGIDLDSNAINVNPDEARGVGVDSQNGVYARISSGISFNDNGEMFVNISSGLKYDPSGNLITVDQDVSDVVAIVKRLAKELDGKLTTNMNVIDAKQTESTQYSCMPGTADRCAWGASLFTVPLQHNLNEDSEISFITHTGLGSSTTFPIMLGILEYNFDYYDEDQEKFRSQTTWIADTGLIWRDLKDVYGNDLSQGGRHTYKLKHLVPYSKKEIIRGGRVVAVNEIGPTLRSDRAYYIVWFARRNEGMNHITADDGYRGPTNSDPYFAMGSINPYWHSNPNDPGQAMQNWDQWVYQQIGENFSFSGISYWSRDGEGTVVNCVRPFVMIRNTKRT